MRSTSSDRSRGVLERRPASCVFVEVVRKKFVRKADKGATETSVLIADPLALPIAKGIVGPGLLAETVVKRWCDHQPLHRQESIFARDGLELARSTLSEWHMALALLAAPLIQAMKLDAFQAPYLCTDATGVLVQAPERCKNGHFWVLVAPEKHVPFEFSPKHNSNATAKSLEGYKGYLVADAHVVYDHLYRGGQIVEAGCVADTQSMSTQGALARTSAKTRSQLEGGASGGAGGPGDGLLRRLRRLR